jgi:deoxyribonuclease V
MPEIDVYACFYDLVRQIPRGRVSTYGALARALGDVRAARAAGEMLAENPDPKRIPCHRVVRSDGTLGGFTHPEGLKEKIRRLREEGVEVRNGRIVDFESVVFEDFRTSYPLRALREEQLSLRSLVKLEDRPFDVVVGVDVAYAGRDAFGVGVAMNLRGKVLEIHVVRKRVSIPYIPTYLAFREEPVVRGIIEHFGKDAVYMLDGNGVLHPYRMGLATCVGVKNRVATIGVAKSLLCGTVKDGVVYLEGEPVGVEMRGRGKPIYVSPGHLITLKTAAEITLKLRKYRVPEPTRLAHLEAKAFRERELRRRPQWSTHPAF